MENKQRKITDLKLSEYNPRTISEKALNSLKRSIKEFGWLSPIVINMFPGRENVVISGHQRIKAAQELGQEEVPTIEVSLNPTKEKTLNLAMNKIGGEFDEDKLIEVLEQIDQENEDLLALTGFNTEEVNYLLGLKEKDKQNIFAQSQEDRFDTRNKYGIKVGDIVLLDDHIIICGDSSDPSNFSKIVSDKKIDLIVTSPPYNLNISYGKYSDNQELKDYLYMIEKVFANVSDFINTGRYLCVNIGREWGPINMPAKYDAIFDGLRYTFFRNIYWSKPKGAARGTMTTRNPFPRYYVPKVQTEVIEIYSTEEEPTIYNAMITYKKGEGEKTRKEQIPKILLEKYSGNVWEMMTETTLGQDHPAPFPVQLPYNCIRFFSFEGERIMDPFMGSGSTLIAADQLKRKCYGIEIDPIYVSLMIERFLIYKPNAKLEIQKKLDLTEKII